MKPHPELTVESVLQAFRNQGSIRRYQPLHEGDAFDRAPDAREIAELANMREWLAEKGEDAVFRTICIGCEQDVAISHCTPCVCGGFVCPDCCASEEDGVCNHEPPDL